MKKYKLSDIDATTAEEALVAYMAHSGSTLTLIHNARKGIETDRIVKIGAVLGFTLQEMADILHISLRTLQRYEPSKVLDTDASGKALKLIELYKHGKDVFGDSISFAVWLKTEVTALDHATPISMLDTPFGFDLIHQILGRIEHGVFA